MITTLLIIQDVLALALPGAIIRKTPSVSRSAGRVVSSLALCALLGLASAAHAGGGGFGADDADDKDAGPPFFGVVQDKDGKAAPDAKITVTIAKSNSTLVLHADSQGHFFVRGFDKSINPNDVALACSKDGYRNGAGVKAAFGGGSAPIEVICNLDHE